MCELCARKGMVFSVDHENKRIKACSNCITTNKLTGWSK